MDTFRKIVELLETEKLCFLATSYQDDPHVCLMNFTYLPGEEMIIMSSRADTTKMQHIAKNPAVAVLLYSPGGGEEMPVSCTLYGTAKILPAGKDSSYRKAHYEKHPLMGTFISGENIFIILVRIEHAALADIEDSVRTWSSPRQVKRDS